MTFDRESGDGRVASVLKRNGGVCVSLFLPRSGVAFRARPTIARSSVVVDSTHDASQNKKEKKCAQRNRGNKHKIGRLLWSFSAVVGRGRGVGWWWFVRAVALWTRHPG
nr:hypothetical protein [Pandoravirus massiliensis]